MALPAPITAKRVATVVPVSNSSNRISSLLSATVQPDATSNANRAITESHQVVTNLAGGRTLSLPLAGISYYLEFLGTTGGIPNNFKGIQIRAINRGQPRAPLIHVMGTGLRFGTQAFSGIELTNLDAVNTARMTITVGGGVPNNSYDEFIDKRVILSGTAGAVTVTTAAGVNLSVVPGISSCVSYTTRDNTWADSLGAGATQAVADGYLGRTRRSIVFGNDDPVAVLTVLDAGGAVLGSVQPSTSFYLETAGTIQLHNPSGGAVVCHIGEVYFT